MSLFGRDIKAGQKAKAHTRLVIAAGTLKEQVSDLYKEYVKGLAGSAASNAAP